MKSGIICRLVVIVMLYGCYSPARAQANALDAAIKDLQSSDQQVRERAYDEIKNDESALARPDIRKALVDLLDREERVDRKPDEETGEGYIEYLGSLTETVARTANWRDPREVCVLSLNTYFPSEFATELASKGGKTAVPCLLKAIHNYPQARATIIPLLLQIENVATDLTESERQQIFVQVASGLHDSDPGVRLSVALAAKSVGTSKLIPILTEIERSDPYSDPPGTKNFPVREAASKAMLAIRERTKSR